MLFTWNFLNRIIISVIVALIGHLLFNLNVLTFPEKFFEEHKEIRVLLPKKTDHWKNIFHIVGFVILAETPPSLDTAFTLPMFLRAAIVELEEMGLQLLIMYFTPCVAVMIYRMFFFKNMFGHYAVRYLLLKYVAAIGTGMLFCQGFEILAKLIVLSEPANGSLLYFVAFGVFIAQIIYIAWNLIHFGVGFFLSFFSEETQEEMLISHRIKSLAAWNRRPSDNSSQNSDIDISTGNTYDFPDSLKIGGESYRLEHSDSEKASYYCPRTGDRQSYRKEHFDT